MKILELRFQNLNSLYGEWCIDFTDPEYAANGIFALTGPTGAGKSTILDAVCLALYGTTPRLGKITKSSNEIMSRQTGQCSAEVTFVSQAGRFCCHWSQHRARKKPGGRLADPKHEISDALTGKPIETKKSLVPGVVEAKTGMDFERFTRSILLAQGGFDTFLKAGIEQKSKILEQITGTGIYSEISRRVHERLRDENDRLKVLQAETDGIVILDPEQEGECTRELTVKIESQTLLAGKVQQTGGAIAWLQSLERLRAELKVLEKETESQSKEEEAFKQNRERLAGAVRAAELDGEHATLASCRKQQSIDRKSLKAEEEKLPLVKAAFEKQEKALRDTGKCAEEAKAEHGRMAPLFRKVLGLDQLLLEKKKSIELGAAECKLDQQQIDSDVGNLENARQKAAKTGTEFELVLGYLELNRGDEWLVGGLAGVEVELQNLGTVQQQITLLGGDFSNKQKELDGSSEKLTRQSILVARLKKQLEKQRQQISEGKKALTEHLDDKLLREYRSEKDSILM
jgi:exonuclease SbcC